MKVDYAKKFKISDELLKTWNSSSVFLKGHKKILIILIHGWSSVPNQLEPLAQELNKQGYEINIPILSGHATRPENLEGVKWENWIDDIVKKVQYYKKSNRYNKIIVSGISMGGNISLLISLKENVDGIVLIGTPVHLKGHFSIKLFSSIIPFFTKYVRKKAPKGVFVNKATSYQYIPTASIKEVLDVIKKSVFSLNKITTPILILQAKSDFFVTKYSPWIIYKNVSSKTREMRWIHTDSENHIPQDGVEVKKVSIAIGKFIEELDK